MQSFRPRKTNNQSVDLNFQDLESVVNTLKLCPLLNGTLFPAWSLASGSNVISHGLGRNYVGVMLSPPTTSCSIQEGVSTDRGKFLVLTASAPTTVNLWIY